MVDIYWKQFNSMLLIVCIHKRGMKYDKNYEIFDQAAMDVDWNMHSVYCRAGLAGLKNARLYVCDYNAGTN